jgi:serine/threonine-protein kinase
VSTGRLLAFLALLAVAVTVILILALHNTHRGTGPAAALKAPPKQTNVSLRRNSAHDYDPYGRGDTREHPELTRSAVDRDPSSTWTTENYDAGDLQKPGVGLYVDAKPSVSAKTMLIQTPTPKFDVEVYAAKSGPPAKVPDPGWKLVGGVKGLKSRQPIALDTAGQDFRYYLIWITKLPPGGKKVAISEVALTR